ncbi:rhomboid family intramembrane serine protease [Pseudoxanthomonas sp. SL93]|jgi:membrane associated rhomboid family serine protease|uniref:rhomboid family intramembrane serine protease n=1 Tax=Pseudoxanthomonas sp. SL93 TaxID=2995142 RepID=UPI00226F1BF8|nr:rhomboid family intramembrane serine protease [Pseudoxanthomonas sp. SL93]WAC63360.1 rhomboid family intramembrane serine protease [Pseudoxanthomonas sp. SL93]
MFPRLLPVTKALLIANGVIYLLQLLMGGVLEQWLALWPVGYGFMPWQVLSYGFLHDPSGLTHLLFNMLALYMFGSPLEQTWGQKRFLTYFLVCVAGAGLLQLGVGWWTVWNGGMPYKTVGASGGVFGLLLAYGMLFPNQRMIVFPLPMEIRARTLVIFYAAITLLMGFTGLQPGVAHFAHLGGMLFGWLLIRYWRGQPPFGKRRPPPPRMRIVK